MSTPRPDNCSPPASDDEPRAAYGRDVLEALIALVGEREVLTRMIDALLRVRIVELEDECTALRVLAHSRDHDEAAAPRILLSQALARLHDLEGDDRPGYWEALEADIVAGRHAPPQSDREIASTAPPGESREKATQRHESERHMKADRVAPWIRGGARS